MPGTRMYLPVGILLLGTISMVYCQNYGDMTSLRSSLLSSYNADVLPLNNQSGILNINMSLMLFNMPDVDPVSGSVTFALMFRCVWYDEQLTWTPASHGGIEEITMKSENVWTPALTVANPIKFKNIDQSWMPVTVTSDGMVSYSPGDIIEFSCSFYMKFWPFDKHICEMAFFPYGYPDDKVTFTVPGAIVNTDCYDKNGEWMLMDSFDYRLDTSFNSTQIIYTFKIARMPTFYILTVIMPITGMGALVFLVFILPHESGERVSYSITIMLALAVFLTVTADELPKNAAPVPVLCIFILFGMIVCVVGLIFVILNMVLFHRSDTVKISPWYKSLVRLSRCRRNRNRVLDDQHGDSGKMRKLSDQKGTVFVRPVSRAVSEDSTSFGDDEDITWQDVSRAIDKLLFYVMALVTYVPTIIILIYIAAATDFQPIT